LVYETCGPRKKILRVKFVQHCKALSH
jgi:hypothetical protein